MILNGIAKKNDRNIRKHKIDFQDAIAVFSDTHAYIRHDVEHSAREDRFKIVGIISATRIAAVFFTERLEITRIISARKATNKEITDYGQDFSN